MKILVFSDTHLTEVFDQDLYNYIAKLVKSVDLVIINGDFWDAYLTTFDQFVNSGWSKLFPLLRKKNTVYLFGNHDKKEFADDRIRLFAKKFGYKYHFRSGDKLFEVAHGDKLAPTYDQIPIFKNPNVVRVFYKSLKKAMTNHKTAKSFVTFMEYHRNLGQERTLQKYAKKQKQNNKRIFHIFGHTHLTKMDIDSRYINTGVFEKNKKGFVIIENGEINFKVV